MLGKLNSRLKVSTYSLKIFFLGLGSHQLCPSEVGHLGYLCSVKYVVMMFGLWVVCGIDR